MAESIDIFHIHQKIMDDYRHFVRSFIHISDPSIRAVVEDEINRGKFWPEPLIQFNPSFELGESAQSLCDRGLLHPHIASVFKNYHLFKHQREAIGKGVQGHHFVVTSGTGSGKSLTFLAVIFDYLLKNQFAQGIQAVIVYPMNALINSQTEEITKFKNDFEADTGRAFPIRFAQYTGQESEDQRQAVKEDPPHVILTNYMMLELILTRSKETGIRQALFEHLKFLVFDELHTYRGKQGADIALLIRRVKAQAAQPVVCIGTSATMVSKGAIADQKKRVAQVASQIFGAVFTPDQIIHESLTRCFADAGDAPTQQALREALHAPIDPHAPEDQLKTCPLAIWLENRIALCENDGMLIRNQPMRFSAMVTRLAQDAGVDEALCAQQLRRFLKWLAHVNNQLADKRYALLPYKIHQFISQTGSVHVSLDDGPDRIISLDPASHKGQGASRVPLFPVVFSRISGHAFICVNKDMDKAQLKPREFREILSDEEDITSGYIITDMDAWNPETDLEQLPDAWIQADKQGGFKPQKKYKHRLPQKIYFDRQGYFSSRNEYEYQGWFMAAKLLFDPTCGAQYDPQTNEATKLTRLGSEGRSTSTTVLAYSILKQLEAHSFQAKDQKLLSFTDNRQDAALQSGHFNDSLKVIRFRAAVYQALVKHKALDFTNLDQAIFDALDLAPEEYAANPSTRFAGAIKDNQDAFKHYLMYRALYDLRHGWRVMLPNLEQCALLAIDYKYL